MLFNVMLGSLLLALVCFVIGRLSVRPTSTHIHHTGRVEMQEHQ